MRIGFMGSSFAHKLTPLRIYLFVLSADGPARLSDMRRLCPSGEHDGEVRVLRLKQRALDTLPAGSYAQPGSPLLSVLPP